MAQQKKNADEECYRKLENLKQYFRSLKSVAVAFSGGVDSTFLLKAAHEALGDRAIALTVQSAFFPHRELQEAADFCKSEGISQLICKVEELDIPGVCENPRNRCYLCKRELFQKMKAIAQEQGVSCVAEGSNLDDTRDYRPGLLAVAELGIKSPLRECNLTKQEIRLLSRDMGLPTWDKPSFACLASRFVYGEQITREKLAMVEKAEELLLELGFGQVRVRIHGTMARIEVLPEEFSHLMEVRERVLERLESYGFTYVSLDLKGYRTGSMNVWHKDKGTHLSGETPS
ncbi:MAG: ATP-dependent sacrificial sulfur transferase LarE [Eubacteriales bacterium]|nr:ATP-dependent sacrificial sulfur transferase LarE [Eubacteriales bacterium]